MGLRSSRRSSERLAKKRGDSKMLPGWPPRRHDRHAQRRKRNHSRRGTLATLSLLGVLMLPAVAALGHCEVPLAANNGGDVVMNDYSDGVVRSQVHVARPIPAEVVGKSFSIVVQAAGFDPGLLEFCIALHNNGEAVIDQCFSELPRADPVVVERALKALCERLPVELEGGLAKGVHLLPNERAALVFVLDASGMAPGAVLSIVPYLKGRASGLAVTTAEITVVAQRREPSSSDHQFLFLSAPPWSSASAYTTELFAAPSTGELAGVLRASKAAVDAELLERCAEFSIRAPMSNWRSDWMSDGGECGDFSFAPPHRRMRYSRRAQRGWSRFDDLFATYASQLTVEIVLFSKDRPFEVEAILSSLRAKLINLDWSRVTVVYRATYDCAREGYRLCAERFPSAKFLDEGTVEGGFRAAVLGVMESTNATHVQPCVPVKLHSPGIASRANFYVLSRDLPKINRAEALYIRAFDPRHAAAWLRLVAPHATYYPRQGTQLWRFGAMRAKFGERFVRAGCDPCAQPDGVPLLYNAAVGGQNVCATQEDAEYWSRLSLSAVRTGEKDGLSAPEQNDSPPRDVPHFLNDFHFSHTIDGPIVSRSLLLDTWRILNFNHPGNLEHGWMVYGKRRTGSLHLMPRLSTMVTNDNAPPTRSDHLEFSHISAADKAVLHSETPSRCRQYVEGASAPNLTKFDVLLSREPCSFPDSVRVFYNLGLAVKKDRDAAVLREFERGGSKLTPVIDVGNDGAQGNRAQVPLREDQTSHTSPTQDVMRAPSLPEQCRANITQNGAIPVVIRMFDESDPMFLAKYGELDEESTSLARRYKEATYEKRRRGALNPRGTAYYPHTDIFLRNAFGAYAAKGRSFAVVGSVDPWYETFAAEAALASAVVVIEYHSIVSRRPVEASSPELATLYRKLMYVTPDEVGVLRRVTGDGFRFDAVLSISSVEHDGLGRYGDPVDPDGDLKSMVNHRALLLGTNLEQAERDIKTFGANIDAEGFMFGDAASEEGANISNNAGAPQPLLFLSMPASRNPTSRH